MFQIVGIVLLVPFFGWAVFLLRRRFVYYEESSIVVEACTVAAVVLFFWLEATVLRYALGPQILLYLFAVLGLTVAGFALYGHVIISLISRVLVDMVAPGDDTAVNQPRFGPVEALERSEDYEGALQEYLVLARIYPRNFEVLKRTARIHEVLERPAEAAVWYLRARKRAASADEALAAVNHLCALYDDALAQPEAAEEQLRGFVRDYPASPDVDVVKARLERRSHRIELSISAELQLMEDTPAAELEAVESNAAPEIGPPLSKAPVPVELVTLEAAGAVESGPLNGTAAPEPRERPSVPVSLERLDGEAPRKSEKRTVKPENGLRPGPGHAVVKEAGGAARSSRIIPLDSMEDLSSAPQPPVEEEAPRGPSLSLESMDDSEPR